jgi:ATP/maltotriose-dependent transcriptional regulator MalT
MPRLIGNVLSMAAYWIGASGDSARARSLFDESAALLRACSDRWRLALLQSQRSEWLFAEGDPAAALAAVREADGIYRERGEDSRMGNIVLNTAAYLLALGRPGDAWAAAREGLDLALRTDNAFYVAIAVGHLAQVGAESSEPVRAARLLGYADALYLTIAGAREPTEQRGYDRALERIRDAWPQSRVSALMAEGAAMEQDIAVAEAMAIPQPP